MGLTILVLSISLSIDAFGIGIAYGMRDIHISWASKIMMSFLSLLFVSVAIAFGNMVKSILPPQYAGWIGAFILFVMGIWIIWQGFRKEETTVRPENCTEKVTLFSLIIKSLGISIKIIRDPEICDVNCSKTIDPKEAIYLGTALSIDSIGVGIASATAGISSFLLPPLVMLCQVVFLSLGRFAGFRIQKISAVDSRIYTIGSGILLILIGFTRLV